MKCYTTASDNDTSVYNYFFLNYILKSDFKSEYGYLSYWNIHKMISIWGNCLIAYADILRHNEVIKEHVQKKIYIRGGLARRPTVKKSRWAPRNDAVIFLLVF